MKNLITSFFLLLPTILLSQNKFSIGASSSIDYCYRLDYKIYSDPSLPINGDNPNDFEIGGLGFTNGIKVKYDYNKHVSFILGMNSVSHSFGTNRRYWKGIDPNDPKVPNSTIENYTYKCFQIPLLASFYWGNKFKFGFTAGIAFNSISSLNNKEYAYFNNNTVTYNWNKEINKGKMYVSGIVGAGTEYSLNKLSIRFEPTYNCKLFDISPYSDLYLWSLGANLSLFYKL